MRNFLEHSASNWMTSLCGLVIGVPQIVGSWTPGTESSAATFAWLGLVCGVAWCLMGLSARDYFGDK